MNVTQAPALSPVAAAPRVLLTGRRVVRGIQLVVALVTVAAGSVGAILFDTDGSAWVWEGTWLVRELVPGVVTFAVVGLVVLRNPRATAVGWAMLGLSLSWGASALSAGLFYATLTTGWSLSTHFFVVSQLLGGVGVLIGLTLLPQVFPSGCLTGWVWRVLLVTSVLLLVLVEVLHASLNWESFVPEDTALMEFEPLRQLGVATSYVALGVVIASLAERVRRGPQLVRQQVAPLAIVWLLTIWGNQVRTGGELDTSSSWAYIAIWLWPVLVALVIGVTAMQVGLWDTRLVVRRFAIYAVVVGVLTLVFAGAYFAVLLALSSQAVDDRYRWLALLVAAVAVIAADPLRRRVRTTLERRLLGQRGEPLRPLARLDALTSAGNADESDVYRTIVVTVAEAVRAPGAALALHQPPVITVVARSGTLDEAPAVLPLLHRGERLGELRVTTRTPGETYGRSDRALLDRLASQVAALVYGLRRDSDIATLRSESIEALIEQRMALGRDLHDGLAPLLAGAGLTADALRRGMPVGSPDAQQAAQLAKRLRAAASEVRRISHDLQPTPDTPHLPAVISDYVASLRGPASPRFVVEVADLADTRLTATTELGLSRVALEAITNVVRHARARTAEITLRPDAGDVVLTVADDGIGIAQPYVSGIGITSMRSRVQAMGGGFELVPRPGGGTVLTARVPVSR